MDIAYNATQALYDFPERIADSHLFPFSRPIGKMEIPEQAKNVGEMVPIYQSEVEEFEQPKLTDEEEERLTDTRC